MDNVMMMNYCVLKYKIDMGNIMMMNYLYNLIMRY